MIQSLQILGSGRKRERQRGLSFSQEEWNSGLIFDLWSLDFSLQVAYKTPPGKPVEVVFLGGAVGSICDKVSHFLSLS